jgi:hypothetical protein
MKILIIAAAALLAAAGLEILPLPDAWLFSLSLAIMVIITFLICEWAERE